MHKIILASASPRRLQLLQAMGYEVLVHTSSVDEESLHHKLLPKVEQGEITLEDYVRTLAVAKTDSVATQYPQDIVLGADTIVALQNHLFGKPRDFVAFQQCMHALSGKIHQVHTAFCVRFENHIVTEVVTTQVQFVPLTEEDITWYWQTQEPLDKAGGYAIQGIGGMFIQKINGSYSNVVGLPQAEVRKSLQKFIRITHA